MAIITCHDWTDTADYQQEFAPTNDPRVVVVIQKDDEASFQRCLDGDAILPTYLIDRDRADHAGGYDDDESMANQIVEAYQRFLYAAGYRYNGLSGHMMSKARDMTARWAWIFHGTTFNRGTYGYQSAYDVLIMNTPAFREHVSEGEYAAVRTQTMDEIRAQAQEWCDSMTSEVADIADGNVYGIGYATFPGRVTDEEPIDIEDGNWDIDMQVWGFIGDDYAKESAAAFEGGAPELPAMLPLTA